MRNNEEPLLNNRDFQRMQDQIKNSLVTIIDNEIKERHWTQVRAATELGTTQPRISNLHNHAVNKFSIQSLNILRVN